MENGSTSSTGPVINPVTFNKLVLSKQQFDKRRKVIIGNLPDVLDEEEFKGKLLQGCDADDIKFEKNAVTISFSNADQAKTTIKALNSKTFYSHAIKAEYVQPDSLLFVGNLPFDFSEEQFEALMNQYGSIERIFLVRSEVTGESKGYGFVEYSDKELAGQAKQSLMNTDSKYIGGRILRVDFAEPNLITYEDLHSKTLFVDKLPRDFINGELLREIFSRTGTVTFAQVAVNHQTGASRGFAFVDYETSDDAERGQKNHNGAQIEGSNIRVAYGTPGRTGASILGIHSTNTVSQVVNQMPLIQAVPANIRGMVPQWSAQPMSSPVPHPLMARPLIVRSPQNIEVRGPAARFPVPLIAQAGPPAQQVCSQRAAMIVRPLIQDANARMGGPPQRPLLGVPLVRGPRPLMADFPIRGPGPRQVGPRGFCPRGMAAAGDPRGAVFRNGPVRPLMGLNSNGCAPEERLEVNQPFAPQMEQAAPGAIGVQPVNQFQPQQQQPQALMQPQIQRQQQQQQLVTPQPQQMQQAPPQPLLQDFRPAEPQTPPVMAPQPLPVVGPNVGRQPGGGQMDGPAVPGVEGGFDRHGQQAVAPGPVGLVGPGNGQPSEYQIPRPVSGTLPQQGHQISQPAAALFQTNHQSPVKTFLPPPVAEQMSGCQAGPAPLMAGLNQIPPGEQPRPQFTNDTQSIPCSAPGGQAVPVQYGAPSSQPMAPPQPLMQQLDQTPPHLSVAQRPAVGPTQQDLNMQYQNYGFQQQGTAVEQAGTPFMAEQVQPPPPPPPQQQQTGHALQSYENPQVVQVVQQQQQQPVQQQLTAGYPNQLGQVFQPPQQMFQQGPMAPATDTQWVHPVGNVQPVPPMSGQGFQVPPVQQEQQLHDTQTQQWRPVQQPAVLPQPGYGQFQQEPQQQLYNPAQQFHPLAQPVDPSYQQQQQLQIASNSSTPSPIPQHSAAPVMYNTQTSPNEPNQHGQKRPPDHQLTDQSYGNQPQPLPGMGEFYEVNKRPRF